MSEMHICSHDALFGCRCDCTARAPVMSRYPALVPASLSLTDLFLKPITDKPEVVTGWCHGWPRGTTPGMEDNQLRRAERGERTWNKRGGRCIKNKKNQCTDGSNQPADRQPSPGVLQAWRHRHWTAFGSVWLCEEPSLGWRAVCQGRRWAGHRGMVGWVLEVCMLSLSILNRWAMDPRASVCDSGGGKGWALLDNSALLITVCRLNMWLTELLCLVYNTCITQLTALFLPMVWTYTCLWMIII